ncbi:MAG TPA: TIGR02587 family membrane protein [Pyrinomonadaceae bacterium]|nr:TIGR02587 family membrane protein [Pyrinomonadaceae bacterium]
MHELAGAFLFGMPFLYTMEIWWRGNTAGPPRMLAAFALTFVALLVLERAATARSNRSVPWLRTFIEATVALATGLVAAAVGLFVIGFLEIDSGLHAIIGRLCMEGLPFSLGVGLADFLLGEKEDGQEKGSGRSAEHKDGNEIRDRIIVRSGATALGATVIALTLAPTDEIPLIASRLGYPHVFGIVAASLVISYVIVFASNFVTSEARRAHDGGFNAPLVETIICYMISLIMAGGMLWLYQQIGLNDSPDLWASYVIVLGLPASVGGAAGRLAL